MKAKIFIEDLGFNGEGVAHINGKVCFVKYVLPNELVLADIIKNNSKFYVALPRKILSENSKRIKPRCPYFGSCDACDFQHVNYEEEIEIKKQILAKQLKKIGINFIDIKTFYGEEYFYRNKIRLYPSIEGLGFHDYEGKIVEIKNCILASELINQNIMIVSQFLKDNNLLHFLKYVEFKEYNKTIHINFFVKEIIKKDFKDLISKLSNPAFLYQTIDEVSKLCLKKENEISETDSINPCAFRQINDNISNLLYSKVIMYSKDKKIANCYSGAGYLSKMMLENGAKEVYGIELGKNEHEEAEKLKLRYNLTKMENICGDCAIWLPKISKKVQLIVLDPPRKGCSQTVINAINLSNVKELIYISCSNSTLTRDLNFLTNFNLKEICIYDMFPRTSNFEVFAYLIRK